MGNSFGLTRKQITMIVVLVFGTFVAVLNQTLMTPALPTIMAEMSVDTSTAQWLTTGFTLVNAVMIPITAFLIDRFQLKRLFAVAMSVFAAGSLIGAVAPAFWILLAGRMIQAAGAGIMQPLVMTVLLRTFPIERRGTAMGLFGVVIAFAPALGPTVAGLVIDNIGWRTLFYAIAILSAAVVVISLLVLDKDDTYNKDVTLDIPSVILSSIGFGALLYGLSIIGSYGFSMAALVGILIGSVTLVFFFRRQLRMEQPMLQVRVLANRTFLISTIIGMLVQASLMAGSILLPIYLQTDLGYSATVSGLVMLPSALVMGVMSPISGRLFDKYGPRTLSIIGMTIMTVTTFGFVCLGDSEGVVYLAVLYAVRALGMSLTNMPINTWGMNALPNTLINHGTSVSNTFRQVAGSLGTAIIVSVYSLVMAGNAGSIDSIHASIAGVNVAFGVSTALCAIGLVLVIALVKNRPAKTAHNDDAFSSALETAMTHDVYCVSEDATVLEAADELMGRGIGGAPIVDSDGKPVGFVSDGDIVRFLSKNVTQVTDINTMITYMLDDGTEGAPIDKKFEQMLDMKVIGIATRKVVGIQSNMSLTEACRVLSSHHLKKAPVFENGRMIGIVTRSNLVKLAIDAYKKRQTAEQGQDASSVEASESTGTRPHPTKQ